MIQAMGGQAGAVDHAVLAPAPVLADPDHGIACAVRRAQPAGDESGKGRAHADRTGDFVHAGTRQTATGQGRIDRRIAERTGRQIGIALPLDRRDLGPEPGQ